MGFLRKDHVMGVLEDDRVGTMACYESKQERDIVKFCYDSMKHVLDRLPQYRPDNVYENAKDTNVPGKWIPCSERLPKDRQIVLADIECSIEGRMCIFAYLKIVDYMGRWINANTGFPVLANVVQWTPLPEPYREVTDEDNLESRR